MNLLFGTELDAATITEWQTARPAETGTSKTRPDGYSSTRVNRIVPWLFRCSSV